MGYTVEDVRHVRFKRECQQSALLTDRSKGTVVIQLYDADLWPTKCTVWTRIRPILEPAVLERKRERLEGEMRSIRSARRLIVHTSYQEYQEKLKPAEWKYLPRTLDICGLDPFTEVIDAAADIAVTAADFMDAFRQLPDLLTATSDARKLHARSLIKIPLSVIQPAPEPGETLGGDAAMSSQPDTLELATAAFTCEEPCCNAPCLLGWDSIAQHQCRLDLDSFASHPYWEQQYLDVSPGLPKISFSFDKSEIAAAIVRAAGLDHRVATVSDMDAKDLRYGCSICPPEKENGNGTPSWTKDGYKWRDFVRFLHLHYFFFVRR